MMRIGVDTGGTFTDLVCLEEGRLRIHKLPSTPDDPSRAILDGIGSLMGREAEGAPYEVTHGSTVATNAVLERKGARIALLTTAGFEDVVLIGRQARPELYNFGVRRPEPLVPRELTLGVAERATADGGVLEPLEDAEMERVTAALRALGVASVAVCFLHSYVAMEHERAMAARLRQAGFSVSVSHEILPEYREFERWATTAVNAYVAPLMARYLRKLQDGLGENGLRVMQSNGGAISAERAGCEAVQTILSGPAAGVVGAQALGEASGFSRLITFDMGGTSTDVSLVDGVIGRTNESLVGDLPVRLPVLDIHTVGAGGGSIAWVDAGGALRVGPRSAGANPGPVCFGLGEELAVTDAQLLLGRLDPAYFLGGRMRLDAERTARAAAVLARRLGLSVLAFAEGVVRIANANMERAIRVVSVQRGHDPRDFALLAFGGAGGLHACELAASLDMRTVLVPEHAGVLSALGMLLADVAKDYSASVLQPTARLTMAALREKLDSLLERAQEDLAQEGVEPGERMFSATVAMRYQGQAFEIDVELPADVRETPWRGDGELRQHLDGRFHTSHARLYGYSNPARATELVQLRLRATGLTTKPLMQRSIGAEKRVLPQPDATREVMFSGQMRGTPVWHRGRLAPGMQGRGPAIVFTGEATTLLPPGWAWQIDAIGSICATRSEHESGGGNDGR